VVAEAHVVKLNIQPLRVRAGLRQRLRVRRVRDGRPVPQQREHGLHVQQRLLRLPVHGAQEVERQRQLEQEPVYEHHVAHGHGARLHAARGQHHGHGEGRGEDDALAPVQRGQAGLRLHARSLHALQAGVVAPRLVLLVVKQLHRLIVEQRVHTARAAQRLHAVHLLPVPRAPAGDGQREGCVRAHGGAHQQREGRAEGVGEDASHQADLHGGGEDVEHHGGDQEVDAARAAVDGAAQRASLAAQVVAQVQVLQVPEDAQPDAADGALGHLGEHGVAEL